MKLCFFWNINVIQNDSRSAKVKTSDHSKITTSAGVGSKTYPLFSNMGNRSLNDSTSAEFIQKILYIITMCKKLRNRQILDATDEEQEECSLAQLPVLEIGRGALRKSIAKKNLRKFLTHEYKLKKFKNHLATEDFYQIVPESAYECSICLEVLISPTMMLCGHMYCAKCLESSSVYNHKCCLCRQDQRNEPFVLNRIAERIIHQFLMPKSQNFLNYLCRLTDSEEWGKRRKVSSIRENILIDFYDFMSIWRKGVVVSLFKQNDKMMAKIKFSIKENDFFEVVETNSRRIAPFTFFTRKRYLENFALSFASQETPSDLLQLDSANLPKESDCDFWGSLNLPAEERSGEDLNINNQLCEQEVDQCLLLFNLEMQDQLLF